jgi:hypothetical protein
LLIHLRKRESSTAEPAARGHEWGAGGWPTYGETEVEDMGRWRFGTQQKPTQERAEIRAAQSAGRADEYMRGQTWARMIEAETARRRARHKR